MLLFSRGVMHDTIKELNGEEEHIHLLIKCTPQHYIPNIIKALNRRIELYKNNKQKRKYNACSADLTNLKKELIRLKEIDKFALQNSLKDLVRIG